MTKKTKIKVSPSLLAADFSCLTKELKRAKAAGADMLHMDVMDGHFVNNITFGPFIVKAMRKVAKLPLVAHLMIENPEDYVEEFAASGSDMIIFHIETTKNPEKLIDKIKKLRKKVGISLKPKTGIGAIKRLLSLLDEVLVMTVEPGFGGQKFIKDQLQKIREIRKNFKGDIGVDGGVNYDTARLAAEAGANLFAAGTYLFGAKDMKKRISEFKKIPVIF